MNFNLKNNHNIDYTEAIKENIYIARQLNNLPKSKQQKIKMLLLKKKEIQIQNGLFAGIRIELINKKINRIRGNINEEKK